MVFLGEILGMYEGREVSDELCSAIKRSENFMKIYLFLFVVCIYIWKYNVDYYYIIYYKI